MRALFLFFTLWLAFGCPAQAQEDRRIDRFVFVGCNRVGFEVDLKVNPSTANLRQLENLFREVVDMEPRPSHLFLLGDVILGYTSYLSTVEQLKAWKTLYERSPLAGSSTEMVPVVGNHEMLLSFQDREKVWHDYPNPPAARAWKEVLRPLLKWRDGPTMEGENPDRLVFDQEDLSFTVRHGPILYILLNTDTFVDQTTTGDIPLHWLRERLEEGQHDPTVRHIFVMGHKPLVKPEMEAWIIREEEIEPTLELFNSHSKVRAFLTAHYHWWDYRTMPGGVPQIIAGNGGSPVKGPFLEPGVGYFGYTVVDIFESGKIVVESWGRSIPEPYDSLQPQPPATLRETRVIAAPPR